MKYVTNIEEEDKVNCEAICKRDQLLYYMS